METRAMRTWWRNWNAASSKCSRAVILREGRGGRAVAGEVDKSFVEGGRVRSTTTKAAWPPPRRLNDKIGSFRGRATDAEGDLNKALKDDAVEGALNIGNFKDFRDSPLSRPLRDWYLKQQDVLALLLPPEAARPLNVLHPIQQKIPPACHEPAHHLLPRSGFVLVPLGRTHCARAPKKVRGAGGVLVEGGVDGRIRDAGVEGSVRLVRSLAAG
jgi:hypothetical protein